MTNHKMIGKTCERYPAKAPQENREIELLMLILKFREDFLEEVTLALMKMKTEL